MTIAQRARRLVIEKRRGMSDDARISTPEPIGGPGRPGSRPGRPGQSDGALADALKAGVAGIVTLPSPPAGASAHRHPG